MTKIILQYGLASLLFLLGTYASAQNYLEGTHYVRLDPVIPAVEESEATHEVVELFWYGCPHCFEFEPFLNKWREATNSKVNFVRVPAIFNARWEQHARAFYALEMMNELDNAHRLMFEGIHEQGRALPDLDSMARFLATNGIDEAKFRENFNSFAVETKINRAKQLIRQYQVTGVPAIIIDGTYKVSATSAGGNPQVIEIIEQLTGVEN